MTDSPHILLLAGTGEARTLAVSLKERFPNARLTASLAGVVSNRPDMGVDTRVGGFGGVDGLADYLRREEVRLLVDATHPFAAQISTHAVEAAGQTGVTLLRLERPAWTPQHGDNWQEVPSLQMAAAALPVGARAFLAIGRKEIGAFAARCDVFALVRMIEPPETTLPASWELVLARPSDTAGAETALMRTHRITHLVSKNSGGQRSYAKIAAARELGLKVLMIDRPVVPKAQTAATGNEVLAFVRRQIRT